MRTVPKRPVFTATPTGRRLYVGPLKEPIDLYLHHQYRRGGIPFSEKRRALLLANRHPKQIQPWERIPPHLVQEREKLAVERFIERLGIFS